MTPLAPAAPRTACCLSPREDALLALLAADEVVALLQSLVRPPYPKGGV